MSRCIVQRQYNAATLIYSASCDLNHVGLSLSVAHWKPYFSYCALYLPRYAAGRLLLLTQRYTDTT